MLASSGLRRILGNNLAVHFRGEDLDSLAEFLRKFRQGGVRPHQFQELLGLANGKLLTLFTGFGEGLPVLRIRFRMRFVTIRLSRLRKKNEGRGVSGLETERQVQKDERVYVEMRKAGGIDPDPRRYDDGLRDQENGSSEKTGKLFGFEGEPIAPK